MRFSTSVVLAVALLAALTHGDATEVQGQITGETQHAEQVAVEAEAGQTLRDGLRGLLLSGGKCKVAGQQFFKCMPCETPCGSDHCQFPRDDNYGGEEDTSCRSGCACPEDTYTHKNGKCFTHPRCKKQDNVCNFKCGPNSSPKPKWKCIKDQGGCVCNSGFSWNKNSRECTTMTG
jgi:hypothetical protein